MISWKLSLKSDETYSATISLKVNKDREAAKPSVSSEHLEFKRAIDIWLGRPFDLYGLPIADSVQLLPYQLQHNLQQFNVPPIYDLEIVKGGELIQYPIGQLPEGAIP